MSLTVEKKSVVENQIVFEKRRAHARTSYKGTRHNGKTDTGECRSRSPKEERKGPIGRNTWKEAGLTQRQTGRHPEIKTAKTDSQSPQTRGKQEPRIAWKLAKGWPPI